MKLSLLKYTFQKYLILCLKLFKIPLIIKIKSGKCGFFGDLFMTLNAIYFCRNYNIEYEVYWDKSLYCQSRKGLNAWEYFFKSSKISKSLKLTIEFYPSVAEIEFSTKIKDKRKEYFKLINETLKLNKDTQDHLNIALKNIKENFNNILGVHIRMTDATTGFEGRQKVTLDKYYNEIDSLSLNHNYKKIYLATDSETVLEAFKYKYGEKLIYNQFIRSSSDKSIHGHYDEGIDKDSYIKGLEVIIDAYILSKCMFILKNHSRVSLFSLCLNPTLGFIDITKKYYYSDRAPWLTST